MERHRGRRCVVSETPLGLALPGLNDSQSVLYIFTSGLTLIPLCTAPSITD